MCRRSDLARSAQRWAMVSVVRDDADDQSSPSASTVRDALTVSVAGGTPAVPITERREDGTSAVPLLVRARRRSDDDGSFVTIAGAVRSEHLPPGAVVSDMFSGKEIAHVDDLHSFPVDLPAHHGMSLLVEHVVVDEDQGSA